MEAYQGRHLVSSSSPIVPAGATLSVPITSSSELVDHGHHRPPPHSDLACESSQISTQLENDQTGQHQCFDAQRSVWQPREEIFGLATTLPSEDAPSSPDDDFNLDALLQNLPELSPAGDRVWTARPGPSVWSAPTSPLEIAFLRRQQASRTIGLPALQDYQQDWAVELQVASVATEMALQVLRSDDLSDSASAPSAEEDIVIENVHLPGPPSAQSSEHTTMHDISSRVGDGPWTASLGFGSPCGPLHESHQVRPEPTHEDEKSEKIGQSDCDVVKKRGKARMSQEKRRRLARRKEREAILAAQQEVYSHPALSGLPASWSPASSTHREISRGRYDSPTLKSEVVNCQRCVPASNPIKFRREGADDSDSSSYSVNVDVTGSQQSSLAIPSYSHTVTRPLRGGTGPTPPSSGRSLLPHSHFLNSHMSTSTPSPPSLATTGGPGDALVKVEHLRALEYLTTQTLAARQSASSLLPPQQRGLTRSNWRPAYSFAPSPDLPGTPAADAGSKYYLAQEHYQRVALERMGQTTYLAPLSTSSSSPLPVSSPSAPLTAQDWSGKHSPVNFKQTSLESKGDDHHARRYQGDTTGTVVGSADGLTSHRSASPSALLERRRRSPLMSKELRRTPRTLILTSSEGGQDGQWVDSQMGVSSRQLFGAAISPNGHGISVDRRHRPQSNMTLSQEEGN